MSQHRKNNFLTLVLLAFVLTLSISSLGLAAPNSEIPPDKIDTELSKSRPEHPEDKLIPTRALTRDVKFAGLGTWTGNLSNSNSSESVYFLSFGQRLEEDLEYSTEASIKLLFNGLAGWHYAKKWQYELGYIQEPFYKLGVGALYSFSENIGTFINWNRYYFSGSIGFDDFLNRKRRFRGDLGFSYSALGPGFYLTLEMAF